MKNTIKDKSYSFALEVIKVYKYLVDDKREFTISKQFLRSGTAIGALVREAEHAESKLDFIHKMNIALKEANETVYWVELMEGSGYISEKNYLQLYPRAEELVKILASIVKTSKEKYKKK